MPAGRSYYGTYVHYPILRQISRVVIEASAAERMRRFGVGMTKVPMLKVLAAQTGRGQALLEEVSKLPAEGGQAQFAPKTTQIEPDPGSFETASKRLL